MRDRQLFEVQETDSGIPIYYYPDADAPVTYVYVSVPLGSAMGEPGAVHFLEHMIARESPLEREASLLSGFFRALTKSRSIIYELDAPTTWIDSLLPQMADAVFGMPKLSKEVMEEQKGVIMAEKRQYRWHPGQCPEEKYLKTEWMYDCPVTLDQALGTPASLEALHSEQLRALHCAYEYAGIRIVIGGWVDLRKVQRLFNPTVPSGPPLSPDAYQPLRWVRREYHTFTSTEVNSVVLRMASINEVMPEPRVFRAQLFLGSYLTSAVLGELYRWLRQEERWCYSLDFGQWRNSGRFICSYAFPLSSEKEARVVREQFLERSAKALRDPDRLQLEVRRQIGEDLYDYESMHRIVSSAMQDLETFGRILPEREWQALTHECGDSAFLEEILTHYFSPENRGEVCAVSAGN
jgi:predicted Zn-dependent peptidase